MNEASCVEILVEQNERKAADVKEIISEVKPSPMELQSPAALQ